MTGDKQYSQADIDKAYECGVYNGHADGVAEGIKEAVDWVIEQSWAMNKSEGEQWESKLKEWGL